MAPNTTPVNKFIYTSKRCLKVFRSLRVKKNKTETEETTTPPLGFRREFYLSSTSLDKRRQSEDSWSVDTIITLLEDTCSLENRYNEKLEQHNLTLIEGLV